MSVMMRDLVYASYDERTYCTPVMMRDLLYVNYEEGLVYTSYDEGPSVRQL